MFLKKFVTIILLIVMFFVINISMKTQAESSINILDSSWEEITNKASGTQVNFYMWGGSRTINEWVDNYVSTKLKERYNINLNRVPMGPDDYLNKLLVEKQVGKESSSIDLLWINGENFKIAMEHELLFGPFVEKLPNYNNYIDKNDEKNTIDFGYPTKGYEAPYSRAQFIFIYNNNKIKNPPETYNDFINWIKENPGQFTYPAPPDFTGSAFLRHIIYNECGGYQKFVNMDKSEVREEIKPALEFLVEIKPYLWREGETYPSTIAQLDNMFADGEVLMTMGYEPNKASSEIKKGNFPESARPFIIKEGTISNTNFLAIPFNAANKEGALVTINFLESFEAQLSKFNPENWGALPVFDYDKLSIEEKEELKEIDLGEASLSQKVLDDNSVPEIPADLVPIIEEEWQKIVGKHS
ncbi:MAG: ABC transporter substrate-binding protein [Halanaerobiales bacterium]|nr:ABC transporter substrate-binding protein [Halanaerobiales bacterium]